MGVNSLKLDDQPSAPTISKMRKIITESEAKIIELRTELLDKNAEIARDKEEKVFFAE